MPVLSLSADAALAAAGSLASIAGYVSVLALLVVLGCDAVLQLSRRGTRRCAWCERLPLEAGPLLDVALYGECHPLCGGCRKVYHGRPRTEASEHWRAPPRRPALTPGAG